LFEHGVLKCRCSAIQPTKVEEKSGPAGNPRVFLEYNSCMTQEKFALRRIDAGLSDLICTSKEKKGEAMA
jgi:hypothetical protein